MNKIKTGIACLLFAVLMVSACGGSKKAARRDKAKHKDSTAITVIQSTDSLVRPSEAVEHPDMDKQVANTFIPVWKHEIPFNSFSGKAKCHYAGSGQSYDFTANIRVRKDQAAWIMVSALGGIVQVARMYATPDSFALVNYLEKTYVSMKISEVNKVLPFPVDFTMLQNLLIGNALRTDGKVIDAKNTGDAAMLVVKKDNLNQDIMISKASNEISLLKVYLDNDNSEAIVKYSNYKDVEGKSFPGERMVTVSNKGEQHMLEMNYTEARFNGTVDMPFSVPRNYSQK